jgi:PPOX class probable F420-dependent enzyme
MTPDPSTKAGARALERLASELIGWLTTVDPNGQPQSSPIWFLWQDDEILVYSGKRARRNDNLPERPLVAFNLNTDAVGGDVVTMEGDARIDLGAGPATGNAVYLAKYAGLLEDYGWTAEYFAAEYPVPVIVRPTRWRVG